MLGVIGGLLAYDTQRNDGVFEKSAAGKFLKDTGALPYVEIAWIKTLSTSARGYQWAEVNVPVYANITYVALKPYGLFLKDLGIVGFNSAKNGWNITKDYVAVKTPVVVNFVSVIICSNFKEKKKKQEQKSLIRWHFGSVYSMCDETHLAHFRGHRLTKLFEQMFNFESAITSTLRNFGAVISMALISISSCTDRTICTWITTENLQRIDFNVECNFKH